MKEFTTDSMQLAATLALYGHEPRIEMLTERKACFIFKANDDLTALVRKYGMDGEDGLLVTPRDLFNEWTNMRTKITEAQQK